jgi:phosphonate transport system substrate-binding protein
MRERFSNRLLLLITLSFCTLLQAADKPDRVFTFGVVPQQSSSVLAKKWGPLIQRIGQQSGIDLVYRTAPNIPAFEQNLAAGKYDLAYMNPYHYTVFSKSPGYRAMAKAKDRKIHGILVSHKDSGISSIEELDGKTLAFPSPAAFAASILPRAELAARGISFTPQYVNSHESVYQSVALKLFPAGGGIKRTFITSKPNVRNALKILWQTNGYTPHAIAANKGLNDELAERITDALVQLAEDQDGMLMLEDLGIKGFEKASDSDWDDVRALNISQQDAKVINGE